ncbi:MAG: PhoH family protein, partial [Salinivirgaceae bacterium]|nr:PhoH family protein [Salinivirgaceae bacterium]
WQELQPDAEPLRPHEFVLFGKTNAFGHIGRYDAYKETIVPLTYYKELQGITPIGELQAMAFEALMAPANEISVVILYGNAGAGKTFAAVSAALAQSGIARAKFTEVPGADTGKTSRSNGRKGRKTQSSYGSDGQTESIMHLNNDEDFPYQTIMICPPDRMLGDKMAAVPGDERAKLAGKLNAYLDNIRAYLRIRGDKKEGGLLPTERELSARASAIMNQIEICPPGEINGRSFWNTFFICDEAQFNSLSQIKAYIERCDSGTKLALCGDPSQISNPFGWHGNPLARAVRYLGNDASVAVIRFDGENEIKRPGAQIIARSWPR